MMKKYEAMGFDIGQLEEIRLGLENGVDVSWYASVQYDWFQMEEIRKGLEENLKVALYAKPEISYDRMREIRKGLKYGLDLSGFYKYESGVIRQIRKAHQGKVDISAYIEEGYEADQLEEIRLGLEHKADVTPYLIKEFLGESIREIRLGLEAGLDVSIYAKLYFSWQQMREIRLGLEHRVDVSIYARELYTWKQMREIRLGLRDGLDVSVYQSLVYSASDMEKKRLGLEKKSQGITEEIQTLEKQAKAAAECVVTISRDGMQAHITFTSPQQGKKSREEIMQLLAKEGIVFGIKEEAIEAYLSDTDMETRAWLVAEGIPAQRGKDGYYEYLFRTDIPQIPAIREDGSIDYQNTQYFEMVNTGQVLAVYHEAEAGSSGRRVDGVTVPGKSGHEKKMLCGRGFVLLEDRKTYVATESGKIELNDNRMEIKPLLVVEQVTAATGNLRFNGSIWVKGNVGSGVIIQVEEELVIDGNVEAAQLRSGKNMVVKNGVSGGGMAVLEAGGEIQGKFFEGAVIRAANGIKANYAMNCNMFSGDDIVISGQRGALVGGNTEAINGVRAYHVGNRANIVTNIRIGVSRSMMEQENQVEVEMKKIQAELQVFEGAYQKLQRQYPPEVRNQMETYIKIEQAAYMKRKQLEEQWKLKEMLASQREKANKAKVVVSGILNTGTTVQMNNGQWAAANPVRNVTIRLNGNRIGLFQN